MARRVTWSISAAEDVEAIVDYLRHSSPRYAKRFVVRVRDASLSLSTLAERGRKVPEFPSSGAKEIFVDSFRLIYRIFPEHVEIGAVIHMARDLSKLDVF